MTDKIRLRTAGVPADARRPAAPDLDHGVKIVDLIQRGYQVNARPDDSIWSVTFWLAKGTPERPAFINLPEGKYSSLQIRPNKGTEDARLLDEPYPDWLDQIIRMVKLACPDHIHHTYETEGATNG